MTLPLLLLALVSLAQIDTTKTTGSPAYRNIQRANGIFVFPIASYYIGGFDGKYEYRTRNGKIGISLPFNFGALGNNRAWDQKILFYGFGGGVNYFFQPQTEGLHLSCQAFLQAFSVDPYQGERSGFEENNYSGTVFTKQITSMLNYRSYFEPNRIMIDYGIGAIYFPFRVDQELRSTSWQSVYLPLISGPMVLPILNISLGLNF